MITLEDIKVEQINNKFFVSNIEVASIEDYGINDLKNLIWNRKCLKQLFVRSKMNIRNYEHLCEHFYNTTLKGDIKYYIKSSMFQFYISSTINNNSITIKHWNNNSIRETFELCKLLYKRLLLTGKLQTTNEKIIHSLTTGNDTIELIFKYDTSLFKLFNYTNEEINEIIKTHEYSKSNLISEDEFNKYMNVPITLNNVIENWDLFIINCLNTFSNDKKVINYVNYINILFRDSSDKSNMINVKLSLLKNFILIEQVLSYTIEEKNKLIMVSTEINNILNFD